MFASTKGATTTALQRAYVKTTKKPVTQFCSAIVSKHILGRENVCCFISVQTLELQPLKIEF
jgi:hypothetical protein